MYDRDANAIIDRLFTKNVEGRMHIVNDKDQVKKIETIKEGSNSSLETDSALASESDVEEPE